ncbi:hypothetical protein B0H17DRAFT_1155130 [Mycena rosella]|uniref:Uncharacterized protein n=1 Tax=Mycena rosella TaxID=1033263 RepID=A0AAD7AWQ5_MYCRO|nr:hypothetical protein B0H17DRAFT_1155130 [Mycena rosella]
MQLPYLAMERNFTIQPGVFHDCVVTIGKDQFLISAHYSPKAPINGALKELAPGFNWRGELVIVALGQSVPYLRRMKLHPAVNNEADVSEMFQCLGNGTRPEDLATIEEVIFEAVHHIAIGCKSAEEALDGLFAHIGTLELKDRADKDWFTSQAYPIFCEPGSDPELAHSIANAFNAGRTNNSGSIMVSVDENKEK